MIEGFIVLSDRILSAQEFEEYVEIRGKMGYEKCPPDMHFPQPKGVVKLKFAELGLVETRSEAETMLKMLEAKYPKYHWHIEKKYHPDATEVTWYRKRE